MPTQVPIGSMRLSLECTAILARTPGSRAAALISSRPFLDLGHLQLEQLHDELAARCATGSAAARARRGRSSAMQARTRSPTRRFSFGIMLLARQQRLDAARLDDRRCPRSMRLTVPVTSSSPRDEEVVQDLLALGVADLLQDHLLGGLRADAAELDSARSAPRCSRRAGRRACGPAPPPAVICAGARLLGSLVGHDVPAAEGLVVAGFAVDRHAHVHLVLEDVFLVAEASAISSAPNTDVLRRRSSRAPAHPPASTVPGSCCRCASTPLTTSGTSRARSMSSNPSATAAPSTSSTIRALRPRRATITRRTASGRRVRRSQPHLASRPAKRAKSARRRLSGRSSPGDDTSSRS